MIKKMNDIVWYDEDKCSLQTEHFSMISKLNEKYLFVYWNPTQVKKNNR